MRISASPPATGTIAVSFISAPQRQSGNSVEPASSKRSNFDMTPPSRRARYGMQQLKRRNPFFTATAVSGGTLKLYGKHPGGLKRKIRRLAPGVSHTQAIAVKTVQHAFWQKLS